MVNNRQTLDNLRDELRRMGVSDYWYAEDTVASVRRRIAKARREGLKSPRKMRKPKDLDLPTSKKATRAALKAHGVTGYSARAETLESLHAKLIKAHRAMGRAPSKSPRRTSKSPRRTSKSPRRASKKATVMKKTFYGSTRLEAADKAFTYVSRSRPHGIVDDRVSAGEERKRMHKRIAKGTRRYTIKRYGVSVNVPL